MTIQNYRELNVWQKAMDLAVECYQVTQPFPKSEQYGLTSQIRRSVASIPANIAEGHSREHTREFLHFLSIARGSLKELETHLILSQRINLLSNEQLPRLLQRTEEISRMLAGLRTSLEKRL